MEKRSEKFLSQPVEANWAAALGRGNRSLGETLRKNFVRGDLVAAGGGSPIE